MCRSVAFCLLLATANAAAQEAPPTPARLGLCVACHGEDGRGRTPETPHIGGQNPAYLRVALAAYRDGTRSHAAMNAISGTLKPADIDALARWYGQQQWAAPPAQQ